MQKQFFLKTTVLILALTTLIEFKGNAQFYDIWKGKNITISYTPDTSFNQWYKIKTKDTVYYLVFRFASVFSVDYVVGDSIIYMSNSCGTGSGYGIMVILLKPKLKWFFVCGVFLQDYSRGLLVNNDCYTFKRICVYSVNQQKIVFYRTLLESVPDDVMCIFSSPITCLDTVYLKDGYLYFRPNLKWKDYFKPQYRQDRLFRYKIE